MDTEQINNTLSLIACIAMTEMEKAGSSKKEYTAEIMKHIQALPHPIAEHVNYLWDSIINCAEQNKKN